MSRIKLLATGLNVTPMLWALQEHPELWDQQTSRTESLDSPHHGLSDIWARYADAKTLQEDGSHDSIWYPAADVLPVKDLVYPLMQAAQADRLGGVLITRIKPGQTCRPHTDPGWHARHYDKYAVQIEADPVQCFHFEGENLVTAPGDVFWFDNAHTHWVTNDSQSDRITMIVCLRTDKGV